MALTVPFAAGFATSNYRIRSSTNLASASSYADGVGDAGRRDFMAKIVATSLTAASASTAGLGVLAPSPANAVKGADKVNSMLRA